MKSRMNREVHVRFCERFRGEIPLYLLDSFSPVISLFIPSCYAFSFLLCEKDDDYNAKHKPLYFRLF